MNDFLPGLEPEKQTGLGLIARDPGRVAYVDIETDGLGAGSVVTVAALLQGGALRVFTRDDGLEGLLTMLDAAAAVVTFNGSTFDIPRLVDHFRIPNLLCPHVDLRPACREAGWKGGLKEIERKMGIVRPRDVVGVDGEEAIWLWRAWSRDRDVAARARLLRYCAADVVALEAVAARLLAVSGGGSGGPCLDPSWGLLDQIGIGAPVPVAAVAAPVSPVEPPVGDEVMTERLRRYRSAR